MITQKWITRKRLFFAFSFLVIFMLVVGILYYHSSSTSLTNKVNFLDWALNQLKKHSDNLALWADTHPILAPVIYILFYIAFTACSIPEAVILTITGGFLFGALPATCYITFAATVGATIAFLIVRYFIGKKIQKKYATPFRRFNKAIATYGTWYLLTIRFIVIIPFFLVNILAALTPIPLPAFIWTTAVGIIPGTFVYALAGQQLHTINSVKDILTRRMAFTFLLLGALSLLPIVIHRWWQQRTKRKA